MARCTVERLMRQAQLRGVIRAKSPRTTRPAPETGRPADLVERQFTASTPNQLWVAYITYIRTFSGWVYAAFAIDVFSCMVVGWQVATSLYTDLALDALNIAIWRRRREGADLAGLTHHSDRGVQYRALRYTERLQTEAAAASVGSKGDSYDNALAEAFNSLFKAELIRNKGPWTGINDVEIAVAEYVDWFNQRRLHGELGHVTPVEHEAAHSAAEPPHVTPENQLTHSPRNPGLDTQLDLALIDQGGRGQLGDYVPVSNWYQADALADGLSQGFGFFQYVQHGRVRSLRRNRSHATARPEREQLCPAHPVITAPRKTAPTGWGNQPKGRPVPAGHFSRRTERDHLRLLQRTGWRNLPERHES